MRTSRLIICLVLSMLALTSALRLEKSSALASTGVKGSPVVLESQAQKQVEIVPIQVQKQFEVVVPVQVQKQVEAVPIQVQVQNQKQVEVVPVQVQKQVEIVPVQVQNQKQVEVVPVQVQVQNQKQVEVVPIQVQVQNQKQVDVPVQNQNQMQVQNQVQTAMPNFQVSWFNTGLGGRDVGTGSEGDVYVAGLDGKLYMYSFLSNEYIHVEGDHEMTDISRVDVDADGTPYVVLTYGDVYYLDCQNKWVKLPGCGKDIGVGRGGDVWKIGCDERQGGYGIWKLFCKCKCKCNSERSCIRFRPMHYSASLTSEDRKCYWYRIEGGATRIDVHPNGNPWVLTNDGYVYSYDGVNWKRIQGILGRDITVSNEGMTLVVGRDSVIYSLQNAATSSWATISGSALEISAGPFSQPWTVGLDQKVYTTAKFDYN